MFVYSYTFSTIAGGGIGTGNVAFAIFTTLLLTLKLSTWIQQHRMAYFSSSSEFPYVRGFILILLVMLLGFTTAFRIIFGNVEGECVVQVDNNGLLGKACNVDPYSSIGRSFLSTFQMTILGT